MSNQKVTSAGDIAPGPLTAIRLADALKIWNLLDENQGNFRRLFSDQGREIAQQLLKKSSAGGSLSIGKTLPRTTSVLGYKNGGLCGAGWFGAITLMVFTGKESLQIIIYLPERDDPTDPKVKAGELQITRAFKDDAKPGAERETLRTLRELVEAMVADVQRVVIGMGDRVGTGRN